MAMATLSKVFILDKYFTELQKFWETEKKLQGMQFHQDASSCNEAAHLQQKLQSLSSELVTLRNRLHVNGESRGGGGGGQQEPQVPPHQQNGEQRYMNEPSLPYPNKPLPPQPTSSSTLNLTNDSGGSGESGSSSGQPPPQGYYENQNFQKEVLRLGSNGVGVVDVLGVSNCSGTTPPLHNGNNPAQENKKERVGVGVVHGIPPLPRGREAQEWNGAAPASSSLHLGTNSNTNSTHVTCEGGSPSSESSFGKLSLSNKSYEPSRNAVAKQFSSSSSSSRTKRRRGGNLADVEDLIHLNGPLTEDNIIRVIQARINAQIYYVYTGPILLLTNRLTSVGNHLTLASTSTFPIVPPLKKVVQEALRQQTDTGYPQAIILSGLSGSGKTYTSMLILKQLFLLAGGGAGFNTSDAFKHLSASVTVLRSLGTASTMLNRDSSRVGHFIEVQVTEGTVYRTKVHCYFLDHTRVVKCAPEEKNYHIFYQMLAGLSEEERERLHLRNHSIHTLRYLKRAECRTDVEEDKRRFLEWKACLGMLGIPFLDVVRVLAAVILLGNVQFKESSSSPMDMEVEGESELQSASALLGVSESALRLGLSMRTHNVRNTFVRSRCDSNSCNFSRDSLAKSLYCRTVATIVRRANSIKRLGSSGTLSSDSADSVHQAEVASQHASTVGTAGSKASKSMTALNNAVRQTTDGFIGILDMFGFEDVRPSNLEQLCINLCAETMQHFYNTHIFKASIESCREEGIQSAWEVEYIDNVPCIDLISSLRTGLLSMLDVECSAKGTIESYVQKLNSQHKQNQRLCPSKEKSGGRELRCFAIQHYAGKVQYDATQFLDTNRDILSDDLVAAFHKHRCSFGFASHLFSSELKILGAGGMEPSPRGIHFRISPTSHTELLNGDEPVSTLTQDFHTRLDNLLRTLVHAKPHFIRCIKMNQSEQPDLFDRHVVAKQLRAFQVLETVNLMANGFPHRMRFKAFNARYKLLGPFHQLHRTEERVLEDSQLILESFDNCVGGRDRGGNASLSWALGKRHVFLSEGARQQLELLRTSCRNGSATVIQCTWRGFHCRQRWPILRQGFHHHRRFTQQPHPDFPPNLPPPNNPFPTPPSTSTIPRNQSASLPHILPNGGGRENHSSSSNPEMPPSNMLPLGRGGSVSGASSLSPPILPPLAPTIIPTTTATIHSNNNSNGSVKSNNSSRVRPQPITCTPPPPPPPNEGELGGGERCDPKLVQQTCSLFGLDMERPPPLPASRCYTVIAGNTKLPYPQTRIMNMTYPDEGTPSDIRLMKGESVVVIGTSPRRGHLLVEVKKRTLHVPYPYLQVRTNNPPTGPTT